MTSEISSNPSAPGRLSEQQLEDMLCRTLEESGWTVLEETIDREIGSELGSHLRSQTTHTSLDIAGLKAIQAINKVPVTREALQRLFEINPVLSNDELFRKNRDRFGFLRTGFRTQNGLIKIIDFEDPLANSFIAVRQFRLSGSINDPDANHRIPDIVLFVNGLPLVVIELKKPGRKIRLGGIDEPKSSIGEAVNDISFYKKTYPNLFLWNQICVVSDGIETRVGTVTGAKLKDYFHWKGSAPLGAINENLETEHDPMEDETDTSAVFSKLLTPKVLLDIVNSYVAFVEGQGNSLEKRLAKPHQYRAAKAVLGSVLKAQSGNARNGAGGLKGGVVWHTPGAGKTMEITYSAREILRGATQAGEVKPTIIVMTDRLELDSQFIESTLNPVRSNHYFDDIESSGDEGPTKILVPQSSKEAEEAIIDSKGNDLIVVMLQKLGHLNGSDNAISMRNDIVVFVDEAHRNNNNVKDGYAAMIRRRLPNATFVAFTGTPIERSDASTVALFGELIDIYDMTQSIKDGVTVNVVYEASNIVVKVNNQALLSGNKAVEEARRKSDSAISDTEIAEQVSIALLNSPDKSRAIAKHIIEHWDERKQERPRAKGMIATSSKKVAARLLADIAALRPDWVSEDPTLGRIKVVYSHDQSKQIARDDLDELVLKLGRDSYKNSGTWKKRLKDTLDELDLVIIVDMWLTGFDAPPVDTMYLVKPLSGARLIQGISRVNRAAPEKLDALVVDYCDQKGEFDKALKEYASLRDRSNAFKTASEAAFSNYKIALERLEEAIRDLAPESASDLVKVIEPQSTRDCLEAMGRIAESAMNIHPGFEECESRDLCGRCEVLWYGNKVDHFANVIQRNGEQPFDPKEEVLLSIRDIIRQKMLAERDYESIDATLVDAIENAVHEAVGFNVTSNTDGNSLGIDSESLETEYEAISMRSQNVEPSQKDRKKENTPRTFLEILLEAISSIESADEPDQWDFAPSEAEAKHALRGLLDRLSHLDSEAAVEVLLNTNKINDIESLAEPLETRVPYVPNIGDLIAEGLIRQGQEVRGPGGSLGSFTGSGMIVKGVACTTPEEACKVVYGYVPPVGAWDYWTVKTIDGPRTLGYLRETLSSIYLKEDLSQLEGTSTIGEKTLNKHDTARTRTFKSGSIKDLIDAGLLQIGQELVSTAPKYPAVGKILEDGQVEYQSIPYPSPSPAAVNVRGGKSTNGWTFWAIRIGERLVTLDKLRESL